MNSDRQVENFNRLVPEEGIEIKSKWGVLYRDVNDVDPCFQESFKESIRNDTEYKNYHSIHKNVLRGTKIGNKYCVYCWTDENFIGSVTYTEYLDNPYGYGEKDFFTTKSVVTDYRWTKYSRVMSANIMDCLFLARISDKIYAYVVVFKEGEWWDIWNRIDRRTLCFGAMYQSDGPNVQKYLSVKKCFKVDSYDVLLLDMDGDIFRSMNLEEYYLAQPGRNVEFVRKWINSTFEASEKIKRTVLGE